MRIVFVGDIVGRSGRRVLFANLDTLREGTDLLIVNAENAAAGFGVTQDIADEMLDAGIDVLTTGNHVWDKRETLEYIGEQPRLLRPHNFPSATPGSGLFVARTGTGERVAVLNLMGQVFMHPTLACPFQCATETLAALGADVSAVIVDFHAEATSEKMAMGWHLDGRVAAVLGTHTHVPTADERVLPRGTAYISDAGMTGCYDSVIGMDRDKVLRRFVEKMPERFEVASGPATLCGVAVEVDPRNGRATSIERIRIEEPGARGSHGDARR